MSKMNTAEHHPDNPFYEIGYTTADQVEAMGRTGLHHNERRSPGLPRGRSHSSRSLESDRDTVLEQQHPSGTEHVGRDEAIKRIDLHTRERIDNLYTAKQRALDSGDRVGAAIIMAQIYKTQKRRTAFGLSAYPQVESGR